MSIGPWQLLLIALIILLVFGAGKLPGIAKHLAKSFKIFKKGMEEEVDNDETKTLASKARKGASTAKKIHIKPRLRKSRN